MPLQGFSAGTPMTRLLIVNLPASATNASLGALFAEFGDVQSAALILDRDTGRQRGCGIVEMEAEDAARAVHNLNGRELDGRALKVSEAFERVTHLADRRGRLRRS
jgi:RNA recognition motif-containing protein